MTMRIGKKFSRMSYHSYQENCAHVGEDDICVCSLISKREMRQEDSRISIGDQVFHVRVATCHLPPANLTNRANIREVLELPSSPAAQQPSCTLPPFFPRAIAVLLRDKPKSKRKVTCKTRNCSRWVIVSMLETLEHQATLSHAICHSTNQLLETVCTSPSGSLELGEIWSDCHVIKPQPSAPPKIRQSEPPIADHFRAASSDKSTCTRSKFVERF
jgi:hypothetical protein